MAPVMLVDFYNYRPPEEYLLSSTLAEEIYRKSIKETVFWKNACDRGEEEDALKEADDIISFQRRLCDRSGLSLDRTYLPPSINPKFCGTSPKTDLTSAFEEAKLCVCGAMEGLLNKTGIRAQDIDILITTCSIYCPTPSMASMVVNEFKMRGNTQTYHLGGMGCANGVVAVNLVQDLLKAHPNANCVFITHETTTPVFYSGRERSRLVSNVLFRMGASAQLFSNKPSLASVAKYKLVRPYRIHTGSSDAAYGAIKQGPDDEGIVGVSLKKEIVTEASRALTLSMQSTAPHIMTWAQIAAYLATEARRKIAKATGAGPVPPPYQPAFNKGVQHFLLHAGGAKVLDGLGKALKLNETDLEPSRAVLFDYGNVSSSTTWYALGFLETMRGVRQGDKVLQVGVGSGIKCGVNIYEALRDIDDYQPAWERRITTERRAACQVRQQPRLPFSLVLLRLLMLTFLVGLSLVVYASLAQGPAAHGMKAAIHQVVHMAVHGVGNTSGVGVSGASTGVGAHFVAAPMTRFDSAATFVDAFKPEL